MRRFQRGRSTYPCGVCGRLTRATGVQQFWNGLCPQCWDLAGIEDEISDGHSTLADRTHEIAALVDDLRARGGATTEWVSTFKLNYLDGAEVPVNGNSDPNRDDGSTSPDDLRRLVDWCHGVGRPLVIGWRLTLDNLQAARDAAWRRLEKLERQLDEHQASTAARLDEIERLARITAEMASEVSRRVDRLDTASKAAQVDQSRWRGGDEKG